MSMETAIGVSDRQIVVVDLGERQTPDEVSRDPKVIENEEQHIQRVSIDTDVEPFSSRVFGHQWSGIDRIAHISAKYSSSSRIFSAISRAGIKYHAPWLSRSLPSR